MSFAFAFALALQALPSPQDVSWELIAEESDGTTSIDPSSLRRDGDLAIFVLRTRVNDGPSVPGEQLVLRARIDCRRRRFGVETADSYALDGSQAWSRGVAPADVRFEPLGTTSAHDRLYARVCGGAAPVQGGDQ